MADKNKDSGRDTGRLWGTIVYPDSAPADWLELLEGLHIPCYVSPLHDKDDGKPHFHVFMIFEGQKSRNVFRNIIAVFGGVGAELVHHKTAYLMYLCHLATDDKHTYDKADVRTLSGALAYEEAIQEMETSKYNVIDEMIAWCYDNSCSYFAELVNYAREFRRDWFKVLVDKNCYLIWQYIRSNALMDSQQCE